jgi:hypothetical protein
MPVHVGSPTDYGDHPALSGSDQHSGDAHGIGERRDVVTQRRTTVLGEQLLWPRGITSILRYHRRRAALTFHPRPDRADYPRLPKTVSVTLPARTRNRPIALGTPTTRGDHHVRPDVTRSVEAIPATSPTAVPTSAALVSNHARGSGTTLTTLLRRLRARAARVRRALRVPGRRQRLPPRSACRSAAAAHPRRSRRPRPVDGSPATGSQRR